MTDHPFVLHIERVEEGCVRVRVVEEDRTSGDELLIWDVTVNQDLTRTAQKAALKATMDYLNQYLDLSHGGRA
jgi:hypothetical protein